MALIPCPECGRKISDAAPSCPQCGHPMKKESLDSPLTAVRSGLETSYWRLGAFLVVSGILSGVAWAHAMGSSDDLLSYLAVAWLPGVLFGVAVAVAVQFKPVTILSYSAFTGIIYFLAYNFMLLISSTLGLAIAGALAGAFGAFLVVLLTDLFLDRRVPLNAAMIVLLSGLLGGLWLGVLAGDLGFLFKSGWLVWQVPVGLLLHRALQLGSERKHSMGSFEDRVVAALNGPVATLIGLVGAVLTAVSIIILATGNG